MHTACWQCQYPTAWLARRCEVCGHDVWKDRTVDLLLFLGSVGALLALRGIQVPIP